MKGLLYKNKEKGRDGLLKAKNQKQQAGLTSNVKLNHG
jgi:hypothetical protein